MKSEEKTYSHRPAGAAAEEGYKAVAYTPAERSRWDGFVGESRNATFLFLRDYMEYHSDRFADASLIVLDGRGETAALWVASIDGDRVTAHGGLTYGGLVLPRKGSNAADVVAMMEAVAGYWRRRGVKEIVYKCVPWIYHSMPSQEDVYALMRLGAEMMEVNISSTLELGSDLPRLDSNVRRMAAKARKAGVTVNESNDFAGYWQLLEELLRQRYCTSPVHSVEEMTRLASLMEGCIRLYEARGADGELLGGTVLYVTDTVAHAQYIAASPRGKGAGALHLLFAELIEQYRGRVKYFDFGTSNEDHGRYLNAGLIRWKRGFGATGVACQVFKLRL